MSWALCADPEKFVAIHAYIYTYIKFRPSPLAYERALKLRHRFGMYGTMQMEVYVCGYTCRIRRANSVCICMGGQEAPLSFLGPKNEPPEDSFDNVFSSAQHV